MKDTINININEKKKKDIDDSFILEKEKMENIRMNIWTIIVIL